MPYEDATQEDRDDPQEIDQDPDLDDASEDKVECPECGRPVHALSPRCPGCGIWLPEDSQAARRSRGWAWPLVVAILIAMILVVWHAG